jgi:hypothetical protein
MSEPNTSQLRSAIPLHDPRLNSNLIQAMMANAPAVNATTTAVAASTKAILDRIAPSVKIILDQIAPSVKAIVDWITAHPYQTAFLVVNGMIIVTPAAATVPILSAMGFSATGPVAGE